ncbi:hypothetical protein RRF57_009983 [Xylaria bambusicola]|uniref:Uncharacterized protein n=1 Tax=Xylaria bambusicola TaxID=326684 RepID=A0AAN7UUA7_9PEZI
MSYDGRTELERDCLYVPCERTQSKCVLCESSKLAIHGAIHNHSSRSWYDSTNIDGWNDPTTSFSFALRIVRTYKQLDTIMSQVRAIRAA